MTMDPDQRLALRRILSIRDHDDSQDAAVFAELTSLLGWPPGSIPDDETLHAAIDSAFPGWDLTFNIAVVWRMQRQADRLRLEKKWAERSPAALARAAQAARDREDERQRRYAVESSISAGRALQVAAGLSDDEESGGDYAVRG